MATKVEWDSEIGGNTPRKSTRETADGRKIKYGKIVAGTPHIFRPVGNPVFFYEVIRQNEDGYWRSCTVENPDGNTPESRATAAVLTKLNLSARPVFAINEIDRSDGQLKILKFVTTVFNRLKQYKGDTGKDPGGKDGADWSILKTGSGQKGTKYKVDKAKDSPFTPEEIKMIKEEYYPVDKIFVVTPADKIESELYSKFGGKKDDAGNTGAAQPVPATPAPSPAPAPVQQEASSEELPF